MSHSRMLATRRKKQKNKKRIARLSKQAKKLGKQDLGDTLLPGSLDQSATKRIEES